MSKKISLFMVTAMLGAAFCAHAADTSSTITARKAPQPVGVSPNVAFVQAVSTVGSGQSFTFEVPAPRGASNILGIVPTATDVNGALKPLKITRSGTTITVQGSGATSGTLAVSDTVSVVVVYQP